MNDPHSRPIGCLSGARPDLTSEQCIRLWIDLMQTTDELLRSGLAATLEPGEDLQSAYRQWHQREAREHDAMIENLARRLAATQNEPQLDASSTHPGHA